MRLAGASGSGNSADGRVGSQYLFRDTDGNVGALSECCPHRGASLYFGRNEECGLRCAYHGWKFDVHGNCVDLPSEEGIRKENFEANLKARAYPCREVNHMVWLYLDPARRRRRCRY